MVNIKIQKITPTAKIPTRAHPTDTGYDLFVDRVEFGLHNNQLVVYTGIAVQPEPGYYVEIFPRSSISKKYAQLANSVGIIDESYTGEIILVFNGIPEQQLSDGKLYSNHFGIAVGEKIAQMVVRQRLDADFLEVNYLDNTVRGSGSFGSTGK